MNDHEIIATPAELEAIMLETRQAGFRMASEPQIGALLRTLAASKPSGRFLELGTGTGIGTAWLLAGMDAQSQLDSVENDDRVLCIARRHLGHDPRVTFHPADGATFLAAPQQCEYDLIFADTWPGKFTHLDLALRRLAVGGIYFIDDLLPQPNWTADHAPKVPVLIAELEHHPDLVTTRLAWATGLMVVVRTKRY